MSLTAEKFETIDVRVDGGVVRITFSRPHVLNAFNEVMERELRVTCAAIANDPTLRVVVVQGAEANFMCGADIAMLQRWASAERSVEDLLAGLFTPTTLEDLPQPVVAAVDGYALGMGLEVALASDFRILTARAVVGLPEIRLAVIPGAGGTQRLTRLAGRARASELVMTGATLSAEDALAWGIATRVVPHDELEPEIDALVERLLSLSPLALRNAKAAILAASREDLDSGLAVERRLFGELVRSEDAREGTQAFIDKRRASFVGR